MEDIFLKQKKLYEEILEEYKKLKNNNKNDNNTLNRNNNINNNELIESEIKLKKNEYKPKKEKNALNNINRIKKIKDINLNDLNGEIKIKYKIDSETVNIFSDQFVKKNQNNCIIIYDDEQYKLMTTFLANIYERNKGYLNIQLKLLNNINDFSYMFESTCVESISFSNFYFQNDINMSFMFSNCRGLAFFTKLEYF